MDVKITPKKLCGKVMAKPSKSQAHRIIFASALSFGQTTTIRNVEFSKDIEATVSCVSKFGVVCDYDKQTKTLNIDSKFNLGEDITFDCNESGSTMRFLLSVASALGIEATFVGHGKLPTRPFDDLANTMIQNGVEFSNTDKMPFRTKGKLKSGRYTLPGNVSSQFVTSLLFALPLLNGDSEIVLTTKLESKPYVDMTIDVLKQFSVDIEQTQNGYFVKGGQTYKSQGDYTVEGDYSNAGFWVCANTLGSQIEIDGLNENSLQGDKAVIEICKSYKQNNDLIIDATDIPDLVPVLAVTACNRTYITKFQNVARLRIKECDRLDATTKLITALGGQAYFDENNLTVVGKGTLQGGVVDSFNDHRIAMAAAIGAIICTEAVTIKDAQAVSKSYPQFFEDYNKLGGNADVI